MVDLDELDRLHAASTSGEWRVSTTGDVYTRSGMERVGVRYANSWAAEGKDITYVVALHNAYPALAAEVRALREVAEAARAFVPICEETHVPDGGEEPVACGQRATHIDRLNGYDLGPICTEHAELSLASARKAASKGHTRAVELDAPRDIDPDARVDRLATALAKVPR